MKRTIISTGIRVAVASVLVAGMASDGYAGSATGLLNLNVTVSVACSVTVVTPALPGYVSGNPTPGSTTATTLTPVCAAGANPLYITLDLGQHSANYNPRNMLQQSAPGTSTLSYYITDAIGGVVGDGVTAGTHVLGTGGAGLANNGVALVSGSQVGINIVVNANQAIPADTYADQVTATLYF